jgi:hypothetical protein
MVIQFPMHQRKIHLGYFGEVIFHGEKCLCEVQSILVCLLQLSHLDSDVCFTIHVQNRTFHVLFL